MFSRINTFSLNNFLSFFSGRQICMKTQNFEEVNAKQLMVNSPTWLWGNSLDINTTSKYLSTSRCLSRLYFPFCLSTIVLFEISSFLNCYNVFLINSSSKIKNLVYHYQEIETLINFWKILFIEDMTFSY